MYSRGVPKASHRSEHLEDLGGLRPEIALSWKRVRLSGLEPDAPLDGLGATDFDPRSPLMVAASPVLEAMEAHLSGTSYCILLADREGRIVHRWFDDTRVEKVLDDIGVRTGSNFLEESVGTNALGTVLELRKGLNIHGAEHFVEALKQFSCYGHPIRHPLTKRIEGVLDLTGQTSAANPLLAPLIVRAVDDIEQRLLDGTKSSERHLFAAFQAASSRRHKALAGIGENVVLTNRAALDLLEPSDYALLRMLMGDLQGRPEVATQLQLTSGEMVRIQAARVFGAGGGTLFHIDSATSRAGSVVGACPAWQPKSIGLPLLISGGPGTGRSSTAREMALQAPIMFLSAATAVLAGDTAWASEFETMMRARTGTLCVEGINLLSDPLLTLLIDSLATSRRPELIFTSGLREELAGLAITLASTCIQRVDLQPLSSRGTEMHELATRAIRDVNPASRVRLTPSVIEALSAQKWPGNLHELKAVMTHVAQRRTTGDVVLSDLPETYRSTTRERQLAGRERAEREAIIRALVGCDGNKTKASKELGVSRTTLYARMRALRITSY